MKNQPNNFFRKLPARARWVVARPELFPELYPNAQRRMPPLRIRQQHAAILEVHFKCMDLESRRCGTPREDGSFWGLSEKQIALRTGIGDPRVKTKHGWQGRTTVQTRIRELRHAGMLHWGNGELIKRGLACNPRHEKRDKPGEYKCYPSVRRVSVWVITRVRLDRQFAAELEDLGRRRLEGRVNPIVDVHKRRLRDREIKMRQRAREREDRILVAERERTVAAKQRTPRKNE